MTAGRTERHYRRLLWAYPRSYRDHRGAEMLTTLLEMAEDGRRPGFHLIISGLWQRFRLPARRPLAWMAALLAAVVLGGFGAAAGTWTAWRTATAVPSDPQLRALNAAMSGVSADASLYHETTVRQGPNILLLTDGAADWSAARIRDTLTGAGWRITTFQESDGRIAPREWSEVSYPTKNGLWTATRDGLRLRGEALVFTGSPFEAPASYRLAVWPVEPAALRPLTAAGAVAGLLAGWLLVAAFARRRLATALAAAGLAAAALPAYRFYRETYEMLVLDHGLPDPHIVDGTHGGTPALICAVAGLLAVMTAAVVARRRPAVESG